MKQYPNNNRGFSIIEVLVATAVLSISLIAVVAIIRTGTDIQVSVQHRQAARMILMSRLEERYGAGMYNMIGGNVPDDTTVVLDYRAVDSLTGTLSTTIVNTNISPDGGTTSIPVRQVTLTLTWQETPDLTDQLTITRWVVVLKYSSYARRLTKIFPSPGRRKTRATAVFRRPVP